MMRILLINTFENAVSDCRPCCCLARCAKNVIALLSPRCQSPRRLFPTDPLFSLWPWAGCHNHRNVNRDTVLLTRSDTVASVLANDSAAFIWRPRCYWLKRSWQLYKLRCHRLNVLRQYKQLSNTRPIFPRSHVIWFIFGSQWQDLIRHSPGMINRSSKWHYLFFVQPALHQEVHIFTFIVYGTVYHCSNCVL